MAEVFDKDKFLSMFGWFEGSSSPIPAHDPISNNWPLEAVERPEDTVRCFPGLEDLAKCNCLLCEKPVTEGPVKTVSIMYLDGKRSYFYRVHLACYFGHEAQADDKAWELIKIHGMEERVSA